MVVRFRIIIVLLPPIRRTTVNKETYTMTRIFQTRTGSYMKMVQTATTWLSSRVSLPPFEAWAKDYRADPDRYDRYLMGLWRSELKTDPEA